MTLEIILTRNVDIQEFRTVMEISRTEKRDDLLSVLKLVDETRGSISAEVICRELLANRPQRVGENIIRRLTELGLLYRRRLSAKGREALEHGQIFMPERGSYRILCTRDPLLPQVLLDLEEEDEKPSWDPSRKEREETENVVPTPKGLKEIEGKTIQLLGSEGETIKVEKVELKVIPMGAPSGPPLKVSLTLSMGGAVEFALSRKFQRVLPPPDIAFEYVWLDILGERVDDWSVEDDALLCDFGDLSDADRKSFTTDLEIVDPELPGLGTFKTTVARNVPVAPASVEDAQRWAEWLLVETLPGYVSEEGYGIHERSVEARFPEFELDLPSREDMAISILEEWRMQEEGGALAPQYWYLRAPVDLNPGGS